jgi:hypothetical protein
MRWVLKEILDLGKAFVRTWNSLAIVHLLVPAKKSINMATLHCDDRLIIGHLDTRVPYRYKVKSWDPCFDDRGSCTCMSKPLPPLSFMQNPGRTYRIILSEVSISRSDTYGYRPVVIIVREGLIFRYVPAIQG